MFRNRRLHQLINDLLAANYRSQQQYTNMLTDTEIEDAVLGKFPRAKLKRIHVYRSYFNRRMHGFGLTGATTTLEPAHEATAGVILSDHLDAQKVGAFSSRTQSHLRLRSPSPMETKIPLRSVANGA